MMWKKIATLHVFLIYSSVFAQDGVRIDRAPDWVSEVTIPLMESDVPQDSSGGTQLLLIDEQYDVATHSSFEHYTRKILNAAGLQEESKLSWTFDPTYQQLKVHWVYLHRGKQRIDLLKGQDIRLLQRERNLEYNLYDGRLTAMLLLQDVRVGDVLEYAYTYIGQNPIFHDRFLGSFQIQYAYPVRKTHFRIVVPRGKTVFIAYHGKKKIPRERQHPNSTEFIWEEENVAPLYPETDTPDWYDILPWIQLSEYESWGDVAKWGSALFSLPKRKTELLNKTVSLLKSQSRSKEEYIQAALKFLQDDIRYFGFEMGANSHRPFPPSIILKQRFGDCKDKTLLFCAILEAGDISAKPVLVNSQRGDKLADFHPSPLAFNHVVTRFEFSGRPYFVDPTLSHQRGTFTLLCFPYEASGLVLDTTANHLIDIGNTCVTFSRIEIEEHFKVPSFQGPTELTCVTKYFGHSANNLRAYYAGWTSRQLEETGREYYSKEYLNVKTKRALKIEEDDESANVLTMSEEYVIDSLWEWSKERNRFQASFYATAMRRQFSEPSSSIRTMPLGIGSPLNISYKIYVTLPEYWNASNTEDEIHDSAFTFRSSVKWFGKKLGIQYHLTKTEDWVPPHRVSQYGGHVSEALNLIGYTVYKYGGGGSNISGIFFVVVAFGFLFGIGLTVGAWKLSKARLAQEQLTSGAENSGQQAKSTEVRAPAEFVGIRGWLYLPAAGLILSPLTYAWQIIQTFPSIFNVSRWEQLTTPGQPEYHPMFASFLISELFIYVCFAFISVGVSIYFFRKKKEAPRLMIIWLLTSSIFPIVDAVAAWLVGITETIFPPLEMRQVGSVISSVCIWIPYFIISQRVKSTFVL
ncbi:MAG: DUF3857 domain-containing protein [Ignavibacteriales bacterium]|nr:DUF3857 domain-containing protein [Ignavibacteriales bacterium]